MQVPSRPSLGRRRLLQLAGGTALTLLAGCGRTAGPRLLYDRSQIPAAWLRRLPQPWQATPLEGPVEVLGGDGADLLQLSDGWLGDGRLQPVQPFLAGALPPGSADPFGALASFAAPVSRLFAAEGEAPRAYPWAFGTWLLLLRHRRDLVDRSEQGWNLLLEPSLGGRLVLPSSPRVVIELARRMAGGGGAGEKALIERLGRLRRQTLAFDERDGLNLLLSGRADAAVLPSQRVLPLLRSDSRLTALLPASGSPLWWNLLLRPAPSRQAAPLAWLRQAGEAPLLDRLLAAGWVPPLPRSSLAASLERWPPAVAALLYPPTPVLERCTSLPPLNGTERQRLQELWDAAAG